MPLSKKNKRKEKKRNRYLYHGSINRNISVIHPKKLSIRDKNEGAVVFASQNKGVASTFIPRYKEYNDDNVIIDVHKRKPVVLITNKKKFLDEDKGGSLYKLNKSKSFKRKFMGGFGRYEYTTKSKVKPIEEKKYDSSLDAMIDNGAQVYFVPKKIYNQYHKIIDDYPKTHTSKLTRLLKSLKSENEKRGMKKHRWKK